MKALFLHLNKNTHNSSQQIRTLNIKVFYIQGLPFGTAFTFTYSFGVFYYLFGKGSYLFGNVIVYLFVCKQYHSKSYEWIAMKFYGKHRNSCRMS